MFFFFFIVDAPVDDRCGEFVDRVNRIKTVQCDPPQSGAQMLTTRGSTGSNQKQSHRSLCVSEAPSSSVHDPTFKINQPEGFGYEPFLIMDEAKVLQMTFDS